MSHSLTLIDKFFNLFGMILKSLNVVFSNKAGIAIVIGGCVCFNIMLFLLNFLLSIDSKVAYFLCVGFFYIPVLLYSTLLTSYHFASDQKMHFFAYCRDKISYLVVKKLFVLVFFKLFVLIISIICFVIPFFISFLAMLHVEYPSILNQDSLKENIRISTDCIYFKELPIFVFASMFWLMVLGLDYFVSIIFSGLFVAGFMIYNITLCQYYFDEIKREV